MAENFKVKLFTGTGFVKIVLLQRKQIIIEGKRNNDILNCCAWTCDDSDNIQKKL